MLIQVFSFQTFRKRVFLMAPIHHHFEMLGWSETKIILRFWIVAAICARSASRSTSSRSRERARPPLPAGPYLVVGLARSGVAAAARCCALAASGSSAATPGRRRRAAGRRGPRRTDGVDCSSAARGREVARACRRGAGRRRGARARDPGARRARARLAAAAERVHRRHGTNGKTTTTELIGHIHREAGRAGGGRRQRRHGAERAGRRARDRDASSCARSRRSSSRTRRRSRPRARCCSTSSPTTSTATATFEAYRAAKLRVFAHQGNDDVAVAPPGLGVEDLGGCARRVCFGAGAGASSPTAPGRCGGPTSRCCRSARSAARRAQPRQRDGGGGRRRSRAGSTPTRSATALRTFAGVEHRLEEVATRRRRPLRQRLQGDERRRRRSSALAASRARRVHLILGGRGKGQDFAPLRAPVAARARAST